MNSGKMSHPHHQPKLSNPSLLSFKEKLTFYNLLRSSSKKPLSISKLPNLNPMETSPGSVTSRNIATSVYEKKSTTKSRNNNNDYDFPSQTLNEKKILNSNQKQVVTNYSEFLSIGDLKKSFRTPKVVKSISKMEDLGVRSERDLDFEKKLKEKYLKSLSFKRDLSELDFNDKELKAAIIHCYALAVILLEKNLNKVTLFDEEEGVFNNMTELIQQFVNILGSFQVIYNSLQEENKVFLRKIATLTENLNTLNVERERMMQKQDDFSSYKNLMKTPVNETNFKSQLDFIENRFILEKQKLECENDHLKILLAQTGKKEKIDSLQEEFRTSVEHSAKMLRELRKENTIYVNKINNLEFTCNNQKTLVRNLEQEVKSLKEKSEYLGRENEELNCESSILEEKTRVYREIACMEHEETLSVKNEFLDKMDIINKVKENYFSIQNKLVMMTNMQQMPKTQDFLYSFDLLSEVTEYFKHNPKHFLKINLKPIEKADDPLNKSSLTSAEASNLELKTADSIHSIDLSRFRYHKPSFYSLIETKYKQFELNGQKGKQAKASDPYDVISETMTRRKENSDDFDLPPHFIAILRGILDCKWNEFIFYDHSKLYTPFPEFVYSWLGKFEIHPDNRIVCPSNNQDPDEDRCQFLKGLVHPIIDKHWDSVTFREFLEEKSSNDEIFFYLYSRFLLFHGPQLDHSQGKFCFIHFVNYERVAEVIELLFKGFDEETLGFLKKKLKAKAKIKNNNVFIDSGFVLRIFLEYYRLERKHRYKLLQELFLVKAGNKLYAKFEEFKQILDGFQTSLTDLEKAGLYREAYNVSQGKIDPETIFLVLSENNFFIRTIKTRMQNSVQPRKSSVGFVNENEPSQAPDPKTNKILNDFQNLEPKITEVANIAGSMGLESLHSEIQSCVKNFKKQGNVENWEFNGGKSLLYTYFRFHESLMSVRNFFIFQQTSQKNIKEEDVLKTELFFFENVYNFLFKIQNQQIVKEMEENAKARKIQKWVQVRFSRWLKLLYTIFKVKIHYKKVNSGHYAGNQVVSQVNSNKSIGKDRRNVGS